MRVYRALSLWHALLPASIALVIAGGCGKEAAVEPLSDGGAEDGAPASLAPGAVLDGGTSAEAGPGGDTGGMTCGAVRCPTSGAICCAYPSQRGDAFSYLCVGGATCPVADAGRGDPQTPTVLGCTTTSNCAIGTVCCIHTNEQNEGAQSSTSACRPTCTDKEAQLCDPAAATTGCAASAPCSSENIASWELPPTFATCGGVEAP